MIAGVFDAPAWVLAWFYSFTSSYAAAIALIAVLVMILVTPLNLKSTKGMLEMQRLAPEMRKLQAEHRGDRQKLNEEMMKLYQEHKVNPMASCLPLVAQMPVFIIMFRILHGLTYKPGGANRLVAQAVLGAGGGDPDAPQRFLPRYIDSDSDLYQSLVRKTEMNSLGLDLSLSPAEALGESFGRGLIYALLVVVLGGLYFFQQRMVAARAAVSPTMSPGQQKLMQYLPVVFAIFQIFFLLGLVIYYIVQSVLRILQQVYITKRFYGHDEALGRQAQRAGERARELAKQDGGGGGMLAQARRDLADAKTQRPNSRQSGGKGSGGKGSGGKDSGGKDSSGKSKDDGADATRPGGTKRTTAPKSRPTPTNRASPSRPGGNRPKSRKKR
jgi:YidC/Oxa1 family membrane protein insertase